MGAELAVAGMVISLASGLYQYKSAQDAADAQEDIADQNAKREQREAEEMASRAESEAAREQSLARARAAASGVGGESTDLYISDLTRRRNREIDWMRESGKSRAKITRREGRHEARATRAQGVGAMFSALGGAAQQGSDVDWDSIW